MSWDWEKLKEQQRGKDHIPPQMDDFLKKLNNFKMPGGLPLIILVIIAILVGSTMFYTVAVDEVGIIQRFGKYVRQTDPGLHFKLPAGIEKVSKVKVRRVYKDEFGFRSADSDARVRVSGIGDDRNVALMLTGDLNVAVVPWIVQYRIKDPYNYLFKVADVRELLRDMSEAAMRLVVGDRSINEVISKRDDIANEAHRVLQKELDGAEAGINIVTIEMKRTNVPEPVQPSFNEVNQATQEKERLVYEAKEEYNTEIPAARGEADRTVKTAEGYALDRVNRAMGDADRFTSVYEAYAKAKDVTKRRLYLETLQELFPKLGPKYIIDGEQNNVLPLLNLGKDKGGVIQ